MKWASRRCESQLDGPAIVVDLGDDHLDNLAGREAKLGVDVDAELALEVAEVDPQGVARGLHVVRGDLHDCGVLG